MSDNEQKIIVEILFFVVKVLKTVVKETVLGFFPGPSPKSSNCLRIM